MSTSSVPCWEGPEAALRGAGVDVRRRRNLASVIVRGSASQSEAVATAASFGAPCVAYLHPSTLLGALVFYIFT